MSLHVDEGVGLVGEGPLRSEQGGERGRAHGQDEAVCPG